MSVAVLLLLVMFVLSVIAFEKTSLKENLLLHPYRVVRERRYFTLLTSGFVHNDWLHLIFNAVTFYFFAIPLEQIVGVEFFLMIYFGSLLASSIPDVLRVGRDFRGDVCVYFARAVKHHFALSSACWNSRADFRAALPRLHLLRFQTRPGQHQPQCAFVGRVCRAWHYDFSQPQCAFRFH